MLTNKTDDDIINISKEKGVNYMYESIVGHDVHSLLRTWEEDAEYKKQQLSKTTDEDKAIQLKSSIQELENCIDDLEGLWS